MVPNFALSLSSEGITLLRRAGDVWLRGETVALDTDDLDTALGDLRDRALTQDDTAREVLLLLPNEQIRYLDFADPGGDRASRDAALRRELDGATPYPIDALRYDWSLAGDRIRAAAVALETLDEAEGFARAHGFVPVGFSTLAPRDAFVGAVDFGKAKSWDGPAPERMDEFVVQDATEIAVSAFLDAGQDDASEADADRPEPIGTPEDAVLARAPLDKPVTRPDPTPDPAPVPETSHATVSPDPADAAEQPAAGNPTVPVSSLATVAGRVSSNAVKNAAQDGPADDPDAEPTAAAPKEPGPSFSSIRAVRTAEPSAKAPRLSVTAEPPLPSRSRITPVASPDQALREAGISAPGLATDPDTAPDAQASRNGFFSRRPKPPARTEPPKTPPPAPKPAARPAAPVPAATTAPANPPKPPRSLASLGKSTAPAASDEAAPTGARSLAALRKSARAPEGSSAAAAALADERRRMTIFGAREEPKIGGKPRFLGLMLTTALLLFLLGVAAWAAVFVDEGLARFFGSGQDRAIVQAPVSETAPAMAEPAEPVTNDEGQDVQIAALQDADTSDTAPAALSPVRQPYAMTPEQAEATYAATGIWPRAPTAPLDLQQDQVEDIYIASIDPAVGQFDAVALPDPRLLAQIPAPADPGLPPAAGLRFDFDDRGLVRATATGAMTPDGVRVFTGRPPVIPPLRTASASAQAPLALPDAPAQASAALAAFRPRLRPDTVVEDRERALLGGVSRAELARMRPVMRPRTAQEDATAAEPDEPATALAVRASLNPLKRPNNMAAIVQRAERVTPQAEAEPVRTAAAVAPRTVTPTAPSPSSVAQQATMRNAINLNRVNLIGVFGKPSSRRALVRLPSGRYQKVKVGDAIDGGRVATIDDDELRYTKGGRTIVLKMPRS
ncbi:hypothetical protein KUH32_11785 [Thalassococcus sp. CAU 1522]|uniref:Type IV pilus biogenesis n=1 Tax=Thalassococcus arenae TaxID=2851652 RepID=A0ABS6N8X0_9RHOB|nr:hypothetical protein [Thalassococcus arenae]MBV2360457.1 hypothetical protein [Thalassococcus arenae]